VESAEKHYSKEQQKDSSKQDYKMEKLSFFKLRARKSRLGIMSMDQRSLKLVRSKLGLKVVMWWVWKRLEGTNILSLMVMLVQVGVGGATRKMWLGDRSVSSTQAMLGGYGAKKGSCTRLYTGMRL